jgi:hypothetical protein
VETPNFSVFRHCANPQSRIDSEYRKKAEIPIPLSAYHGSDNDRLMASPICSKDDRNRNSRTEQMTFGLRDDLRVRDAPTAAVLIMTKYEQTTETLCVLSGAT